MSNIKKFVFLFVVSLVSTASFAQNLTACASTIDQAEAKIATQAKKMGGSYKITEANFNNGVHMTAKLVKAGS